LGWTIPARQGPRSRPLVRLPSRTPRCVRRSAGCSAGESLTSISRPVFTSRP
jgi:hypothetical protein